MNKITRRRWVVSLLFLLLMAGNFAAEGFSVYLVQGKRLLAGATSQNPGHIAEEGSSCCAGKKKKVQVCQCPDCGDKCPMGDACTCDHDGKQKSHTTGLFFQMPGCHPEQAGHDSNYLPLSMRLVFLTAPLVTCAIAPVGTDDIRPPAVRPIGVIPAPPVPPPRSAAA